MEKIILACDESGAKGYANQGEACDGEVGVFAGIMVPQSLLAPVETEFSAIHARYKPAEGKLHIADLTPSDQEALRTEIYAAIRKYGLPCFWYAVHVAGFHSRYVEFQALLAKSKAEAEANNPEAGRFKGGSPRENPGLLHVFLFEGMYGHLIAFLEERQRQDVEIEVRTDRVDNPIVERFEEIAEKLLSNLTEEQVVTRFDTVTNQVVARNIRIRTHIPASLALSVRVTKLEIRAVDNDDGIVLAADVLANHLNYIFKNRDAAEKYAPLNEPAAIREHPLAGYLDSFRNWGDGDLIGDGHYRHPKAQA